MSEFVSVSDASTLRTLMRPQDEAHAKLRAMIEGPVLTRHARVAASMSPGNVY